MVGRTQPFTLLNWVEGTRWKVQGEPFWALLAVPFLKNFSFSGVPRFFFGMEPTS